MSWPTFDRGARLALSACVNTLGQQDLLVLADALSREFLLQHQCCPLRIGDDGILVVALAPRGAREALDDIATAYQRRVTVESVSADELERLIERLTTQTERALDATREDTSGDIDPMTDVRDLANQPPVIRYVNLLVRDAHEAGASDIHLEATRNGLTARVRLDGVLVQALEPPAHLHHAIISRIKLLAELDIAERRRPQDGRIRVRMESRELDLRVATVPTMFGESVALRLLDRGGRPVELRDLGLDPTLLDVVERLTKRPHGLLIVTGPTGSGKTTTLYSCLANRDTLSEKIITVEDPVEYQLRGITQVPVHAQAGVSFADALRSILRQDPDVVMVGEMRDGETADIAVRAAMTGHLVFSTLHTSDALGAIPRLLDLGVPEYLVAATVEAVLAQRLVRRICDSCRVSYVPKPDVVARLSGAPAGRMRLERGAGCDTCRGTGYRGRLALFELLTLSDAMKEAITHQASRRELRQLATEQGMDSLRMDGWRKVKAGITTAEEVLRVVHE